MKKGVLFDLDGTLWDSSREVATSWVQALQDCPDITKKPTTEQIQSVMGRVMDEIADIFFDEVEPKRRKEVLAYCMEQENIYIREHGGHLFPGLEETLRELRRRGYRLYIVSNCQVGYIEAFLEYHRLGAYFDDFESFGGTGQPKGYNIRLVADRNHLDRAVYVGDTQGDYEASRTAGLPFIHTRTGYGKIDAQVPVIRELRELPDVVDEIIEKRA